MEELYLQASDQFPETLDSVYAAFLTLTSVTAQKS